MPPSFKDGIMDYVALDFETANSNFDSACQIGLVKVINNEIKETYISLIKPEPNKFNYYNIKVHGIREKDVVNAPLFSEIFQDIVDFVGDLPLCAHNSSFDMSVLKRLLNKYNLRWKKDFFCSLVLSRDIISASSYKLTYLSSEIVKFDYQAHDALEDSKSLVALVTYLDKELGGVKPLGDYLEENYSLGMVDNNYCLPFRRKI